MFSDKEANGFSCQVEVHGDSVGIFWQARGDVQRGYWEVRMGASDAAALAGLIQKAAKEAWRAGRSAVRA